MTEGNGHVIDPNGDARRALLEAVAEHGPEVLSDADVLGTVCREQLTGLPGESILIGDAARTNVPALLNELIPRLGNYGAIQSAAATLAGEHNLDMAASLWVVREFARALGYIAPGTATGTAAAFPGSGPRPVAGPGGPGITGAGRGSGTAAGREAGSAAEAGREVASAAAGGPAAGAGPADGSAAGGAAGSGVSGSGVSDSGPAAAGAAYGGAAYGGEASPGGPGPGRGPGDEGVSGRSGGDARTGLGGETVGGPAVSRGGTGGNAPSGGGTGGNAPSGGAPAGRALGGAGPVSSGPGPEGGYQGGTAPQAGYGSASPQGGYQGSGGSWGGSRGGSAAGPQGGSQAGPQGGSQGGSWGGVPDGSLPEGEAVFPLPLPAAKLPGQRSQRSKVVNRNTIGIAAAIALVAGYLGVAAAAHLSPFPAKKTSPSASQSSSPPGRASSSPASSPDPSPDPTPTSQFDILLTKVPGAVKNHGDCRNAGTSVGSTAVIQCQQLQGLAASTIIYYLFPSRTALAGGLSAFLQAEKFKKLRECTTNGNFSDFIVECESGFTIKSPAATGSVAEYSNSSNQPIIVSTDNEQDVMAVLVGTNDNDLLSYWSQLAWVVTP